MSCRSSLASASIPLDQAAHRFGELALQLIQIRGQRPAAVTLLHDLAAPEVAERAGHEQRMSFGPLVNHPGKASGKACSGNCSDT
jgi:hypothetical protein